MGLCRSCLRSLLVPATWAKQRAKLEKNKAAIQKNLHEVQVSEFENSAVIKKMKQTCNDIYVGAEARRKKLGLRQIRYTDDEQRAMKQKMSEIQLKLGEVQMQRANMAMYQKAYASITTFIVQQETVTKMKETMRGVKDVGLREDDRRDGTDVALDRRPLVCECVRGFVPAERRVRLRKWAHAIHRHRRNVHTAKL
jgi:hypothetical protein